MHSVHYKAFNLEELARFARTSAATHAAWVLTLSGRLWGVAVYECGHAYMCSCMNVCVLQGMH